MIEDSIFIIPLKISSIINAISETLRLLTISILFFFLFKEKLIKFLRSSLSAYFSTYNYD